MPDKLESRNNFFLVFWWREITIHWRTLSKRELFSKENSMFDRVLNTFLIFISSYGIVPREWKSNKIFQSAESWKRTYGRDRWVPKKPYFPYYVFEGSCDSVFWRFRKFCWLLHQISFCKIHASFWMDQMSLRDTLWGHK